MKSINNKIIDETIEYLNKLKESDMLIINVVPPHIEEIGSAFDGTVFGKFEMDIHISWEELYQKQSNNFLSEWEKVVSGDKNE